MNKLLKNMAVCFAAGCAGGLANSIVLWLAGATGVTTALGVNLAPAFTPAWLYPRIVWGGLWGFLFLVPVLRNSPFWRGLAWSAGPTAVQLCIIFPLVAKKCLFWLALGALTPLLVVLFNAVWGVAAAALLARIEDAPDQTRTG
ncbi:MAG: hypothetical protein HY789_05605 [Deltaproteobacteria bacterium]|nr:hypothetical protein [Deltaproteobacteria bacterium]